MSVSVIMLLIAVARTPGKAINEYAKEVGIEETLVSRYLLLLGPRMRSGDNGLDLIERLVSIEDQRTKRVYLTAKGRKFLDRFLSRLPEPVMAGGA